MCFLVFVSLFKWLFFFCFVLSYFRKLQIILKYTHSYSMNENECECGMWDVYMCSVQVFDVLIDKCGKEFIILWVFHFKHT